MVLLLADPPRLKVKVAPRDTPPRASPRGEGDARAVTVRARAEETRAATRASPLATPSATSAPRPPVPRARPALGEPSPESKDLDPDARLAERATPERANAPRARDMSSYRRPTRRDRTSICVVVARVGLRQRAAEATWVKFRRRGATWLGETDLDSRQDLEERFFGMGRRYPDFAHANSHA